MKSPKSMLFQRLIQPRIEHSLFKGKAIIIYGPRQVGKTTLVKQIQAKYPESRYFNCDEPDVRRALTDKTSTELLSYLKPAELVILDEAQRVKNIGITIKLIVDTNPSIQIIATGSSSFELSNKISEPLTGRSYEFFLAPLSIAEILPSASTTEVNRLLESYLIWGLYPDVVLRKDSPETTISAIASKYLYKDALEYQTIKNPELVEKLLIALALQVGNEVSFNELARTLEVDKKTVINYLRILEQSFVIFRLLPFSRNLRSELNRKRKIYFWDTGIRNALIKNFNPLSLRSDVGALWENFCIAERRKLHSVTGKSPNIYFWRTWTSQEIDYLEEAGEKISAYEFTWKNKKHRTPKAWREQYPDSPIALVTQDSCLPFVTNNSK